MTEQTGMESPTGIHDFDALRGAEVAISPDQGASWTTHVRIPDHTCYFLRTDEERKAAPGATIVEGYPGTRIDPETRNVVLTSNSGIPEVVRITRGDIVPGGKLLVIGLPPLGEKPQVAVL